jgi:hypothetical protein
MATNDDPMMMTTRRFLMAKNLSTVGGQLRFAFATVFFTEFLCVLWNEM